MSSATPSSQLARRYLSRAADSLAHAGFRNFFPLLSPPRRRPHGDDGRRVGAAHATARPARARLLPSTRTRAARRRTSEMITRLGTKVGETDEMRLRSGHRVGVSGPAARIPTSAAEARAMLMKDGASTSEHVASVSRTLRSRPSPLLFAPVLASPPPRRSRLPPPPPPPPSPRADFRSVPRPPPATQPW